MNKSSAYSKSETASINSLLMDQGVRAILTVELAALRSGESVICKYLEGTLTRKIIARKILSAHFQKVEITAADLVVLIGQSRQGITNQLSEMIGMGLLYCEPGKDRRRKILKPTDKMMDYWRNYCKAWLNLSEANEASVVLASLRFLNSE